MMLITKTSNILSLYIWINNFFFCFFSFFKVQTITSQKADTNYHKSCSWTWTCADAIDARRRSVDRESPRNFYKILNVCILGILAPHCLYVLQLHWIGLKVAKDEPIFRLLFPKNQEIISPALQFSNYRKKCSFI